MATADGPVKIAIGGGHVGCGKTLVATNLALGVAQRGARVVLVDGDTTAPSLAAQVGVEQPRGTLASYFDGMGSRLADLVTPTPFENLSVLAAPVLPPSNAPLRPEQRVAFVQELLALDVDAIVVDVGAGPSGGFVDFIQLADVRIVVVTPELTALQSTYSFLKGALVRALRDAARELGEEEVFNNALRAAGTGKLRQVVSHAYERSPDLSRDLAWLAESYSPLIVGNKVDGRAQVDALYAFSRMIGDFLSVRAPVVATIGRSGRIQESITSCRPLLASPDAGPEALAIRDLAAKVMAVDVDALRTRRQGEVPAGVGAAVKQPGIPRVVGSGAGSGAGFAPTPPAAPAHAAPPAAPAHAAPPAPAASTARMTQTVDVRGAVARPPTAVPAITTHTMPAAGPGPAMQAPAHPARAIVPTAPVHSVLISGEVDNAPAPARFDPDADRASPTPVPPRPRTSIPARVRSETPAAIAGGEPVAAAAKLALPGRLDDYQRRHDRLGVTWRVRVRLDDFETEATMADVSRSGASILGERLPFGEGETVRIAFEEGTGLRSVDAVVRSSNGGRIGVEFVDPSTDGTILVAAAQQGGAVVVAPAETPLNAASLAPAAPLMPASPIPTWQSDAGPAIGNASRRPSAPAPAPPRPPGASAGWPVELRLDDFKIAASVTALTPQSATLHGPRLPFAEGEVVRIVFLSLPDTPTVEGTVRAVDPHSMDVDLDASRDAALNELAERAKTSLG